MSVNVGDGVADPKAPGGPEEQKPNSVSYENHDRAMNQLAKEREKRKAAESRLAELEAKEREIEEQRLAEQGEYKKLLELERKKSTENEEKVKEFETNLMNAHKLSAFREKLPGKLRNSKYYEFVPTEKIILDPTTGEIDPGSLEEVVNGFVQEHNALIDRGTTANLPDNAPASNVQTLTYEQWLALPPKERVERFQEMRKNDRK